jgi:hypothetical protein
MGKFMAASSRRVSFAFDAGTTEALALRDGIALANQIGVHRLIIQSDCKDVVDTMVEG